MTNIILCSGTGTKHWPLSRTLMPKQFIKLFKSNGIQESLFQLTIQRNHSFCNNHFIISNSDYLLEPIGRYTAPVIALVCHHLDPQEVVLISPPDHLIKNHSEYKKVIEKALTFAHEDHLVTFGITPTDAEIGYSYIEYNNFDVVAFHEKPDNKTAQRYIASSNYLWNSGMFMFKAGVFLEELKHYAPSIYSSSKKAYKNARKQDIIRIQHEDINNIPEDSIDYAVMEKSQRIKVIPANIDWSDLESFDTLSEHLSNDQHNNLIISKKGSSQNVKNIVNSIRKTQPKLCKSYNKQYKTNFISAMLMNLYGKNDNFYLKTSHVLTALLRKIHEAKLLKSEQVEIWGTGTPKREFLYNEDMVDASVFLMETIHTTDFKENHINIGTQKEIFIKELALLIKKNIGYTGELIFNTSYPDGTMRKLIDYARLHTLVWQHTISLNEGN